MSHFYGTVQGNRGEVTRTGSKSSGIETFNASWKGAVRTKTYINDENEDCIRIEFTTWKGIGTYKLLYDGKINPEK